MNYKLLSIIFVVVISFSFLAELAFAKHIDGKLTAAEVATAFDTFGKDEDEMRKACEGAAPPAYVDDCIIAKKNMFCWWITGERNKVRNPRGDYDETAYLECVDQTKTAKIQVVEAVTRGAQVGMTGVPSPGVAGGVGAQTAAEIIKGVQTAKDVIQQGKEMEKQRKESDKQSMLDSLNKNLLNQKIPSVAGVSVQNEKININVLREKTSQYSIGVIIQNGKVVQISEGALTDVTMNVYLSESKVNSISRAHTQQELTNIILNSLRDGSIRVSGVGPVRGSQTFVAQRAAIIYSKFVSSPFDIAAGQTKTVNFGGREATLEKNPLGQRIVSVRDSPVVYKISKGGEVLGYSNKGTQKLVNSRSPTKCAYKQCPSTDLSETAGYYTVPIFAWDEPKSEPPMVTATITVG